MAGNKLSSGDKIGHSLFNGYVISLGNDMSKQTIMHQCTHKCMLVPMCKAKLYGIWYGTCLFGFRIIRRAPNITTIKAYMC